jgi:hypothetical protein
VKEHDEQKALYSWAAVMRKQYPELDEMFAVPNAAKRSPQLASYMRSEGMKAGVLDNFLLVPRGKYAGLIFEMKIKPNKPTPEQLVWIECFRKRGFRVEVCWSFEEARDLVLEYLRGRLAATWPL